MISPKQIRQNNFDFEISQSHIQQHSNFKGYDDHGDHLKYQNLFDDEHNET